jgi:2-polyprenyl-6-hydroxyphenyl methylase/3-demethylubiquinone-9 3-methyltransferase
MQIITREIYEQIDNHFYNAQKDIWWDENEFLHTLKTSLNPCRFGYFMRVFREVLRQDPRGKSALDVGCGGGILAEEFAAAGFDVTGVDPSENSLQTARAHAARNGLQIIYRACAAECLPFPTASFDVVYCCDVLEHVQDPGQCLAEMARVIKPGGVFFFDTVNRTWMSKLIAIKLLQEWKRYAMFRPGLHVYEMFIKPSELKALCAAHGIPVREVRGMSPNLNPLALMRLLRQRVKGKISYQEVGKRFKLIETSNLSVIYMGYSIKD